MKRVSARTVLTTLIGPIGILPIGFVVAVGSVVLTNTFFGLVLPPGHFSFFRGSDDMGCSNLFTGAMALCVTFGFLASWHLTLRLSELAPSASGPRDLARSLWILKFQIAAFVIGGWCFSEGGGCDEGYGSDFRNSLILAALVYVVVLLTTVATYRFALRQTIRLWSGPRPSSFG
jgi:hypothetical protein